MKRKTEIQKRNTPEKRVSKLEEKIVKKIIKRNDKLFKNQKLLNMK